MKECFAIRQFEPGSIALYFSSATDVALEKVIFSYDTQLGSLQSLRGRSATSGGNFHWSPAVKALSVFLLSVAEHVASSATLRSLPELSGEGGSMAASLDYALAKNPPWLADMFGHNPEGVPYAKDLLLRSNPERKRPGPVILSLNRRILAPENISIFENGLPVVSPEEIAALIYAIEQRYLVGRIRANPELKRLAASQGDGRKAVEEDYYLPATGQRSALNFHHMFTQSALEEDFLLSLHRRSLGRKFAFLGPDAVRKWNAICSSDYNHFVSSYELLLESAPALASFGRDSASIICLWPGSGEKELLLTNALNSVKNMPVYFVDSSPQMIEATLKTFSDVPYRCEVFLADFMVPGALTEVRREVSYRSPGPSTYLVLGNTLASHRQAEILQRLRLGMTPDDTLILDCLAYLGKQIEATDEMLEQWMTAYDTQEFRDQLLNSLAIIGIDFEDGVVEIEYANDRYHPQLYRVDLFFRFVHDTRRRFRGTELFFSQGERILLSFFYQYSIEDLRRLITSQGFRIVDQRWNDSSVHQLVCRLQTD